MLHRLDLTRLKSHITLSIRLCDRKRNKKRYGDEKWLYPIKKSNGENYLPLPMKPSPKTQDNITSQPDCWNHSHLINNRLG